MSIDRYGGGYSPALVDDERVFEAIMRRARVFCRVPGLKKEIQGNAEATAGIMLSLQGYGLDITIPGINMAFDWIQGRAEPSAMFYQAVARQHGYILEPRVRTADLAVAHVVDRDGGSPIEVEFNVSDAIAAHRLDAWVEQWKKVTGRDNKTYNVPETFVIRVNGQPLTWQGDITVPVPDPLPEWVEEKIATNQVKVYTAWWDYRTDMMWKSAAKRAVKLACPHVLLGGDASGGSATHEAFGWGSPLPPERDAIETVTTDRPGPDGGTQPPPAASPGPATTPDYAPGEEPF